MEFGDELIHGDEDTYIYIGRFDPVGFPIVTSRHFHHHASVTLQAISLVALMAQTIRSEPLGQILIRHEDGSTVCVEPNIDGYLAYLKPDSGLTNKDGTGTTACGLGSRPIEEAV